MSSMPATAPLCAADRRPFPVRDVLGVQVSVADRTRALDWLLDRLDHGPQTLVSFANTNLLNLLHRDGKAAMLDRFLVLNDGIGLDLASRVLHGTAFPENLNGTDFTPAFLLAAGRRARVFLFGGRPEAV